MARPWFCRVTRNFCAILNMVKKPMSSSPGQTGPATRQDFVPGSRLHALAPQSGGDYLLSVPSLERPVLHGLFDTVTLPSGLVVHRVDARDLQGSMVRAMLKEGLRLALVIGGRADVSFGNLDLQWGPAARPRALIEGHLISVARPDRFCRRAMRGAVERTISITIPPRWLRAWLPRGDQGDAIRAFARTHLAVRSWTLSAQAVALAEQLLMPGEVPPALWNLYVESRVQSLLAEAFELWTPDAATLAAPTVRLRPRDMQRMAELRQWLDSGAADGMTLEAIAERACMSVNTLQRHFRAAWGRTVAEYLRDMRLARARAALERSGVTVSQAAWDAGYSSAANFATAFRRRYGVAPGQVRGSH